MTASWLSTGFKTFIILLFPASYLSLALRPNFDWTLSEVSCDKKKFWSADWSKSDEVNTLPSWKSTSLASEGVILWIRTTAPLAGVDDNWTEDAVGNVMLVSSTPST